MLSETLRLLRVFHDLKQKDLAEKLAISASHLSELEKGIKTPTIEVIQKYATFFKVPASSIMFFAENFENGTVRKGATAKAQNAIASKIISILRMIEERTEQNAES